MVKSYKHLYTPDEVIKCFSKVKGTRVNWEELWDELAHYVVPLKEMYATAPGQKKYGHLLDTTAMVNAELLAGSLHSMLTSPSGYFFALTTGDFQLDKKDAVRMYLQDTTRVLHEKINDSNFQTEVHEMYLSLVGQGNSCFSVDEEREAPGSIICSTRPMKGVWWREDSKGRVVELYREMDMTPEDMVDEFGLEELPDKIQKAYKENKKDKWEVIHVVYPRKKTAEAKKEFRFDYASQYVIKKEKITVKIDGYYEFPYMTPRWVKMAGETYGRGPGEKALGPAKALNVMRETTISGAQKVVDPPLQAPDDGFILQVNTSPGGLSYYRAGSQDRIQPVFNDARIDFGYQAIEQERVQIREAFYTDQLKLREGDRMTTVEVNQRIEEGLRFMGPMLGRLEREFLVPFVTRIYRIAERNDQLPVLPAELKGKPIKVRYSSIMAIQQRMSEITNIRRTMAEVAPFLTMDQRLMNMFSGQEAIRYIARIMGFPQELIRKQEEVDALNQQQQQMQQQQMQAEQQKAQADAANKTLSGVAKVQQQ